MMEQEVNLTVIIYQMGKVGSTTIQTSLEKANLTLPIYKVHFLSDEGMQHAVEFHQKTLKIPWENTPHIETSQFLREKIRTDAAMQWKIITVVREPVIREISEFFQYVHSMYPELLDENGNIEKRRAIKILQTKFTFYNPQKNYTCRWFDMELGGMFGIDVYAHPFDTQAGFAIINQGNIDVLILRLEDLNRNFSQALAQFLNLPKPVEIIKSNVRSDQKRGDTYEELLQEFTIQKAICHKVYASNYARHFYSEAEIAQFIQRWSG